MKITTVGIDLAKNVFQVHAVDERGAVVLRRQLRRDQMTAFFANLPPCVIGMEACGSAHHWARTLKSFGHDARLMSPQFVKPYVKSNKNDVADAEAICEAVARPNMRFVPVKSVEQQAVLSLHRVRQGFVKARTAQANQIRSLLGEFGLIMPAGISHIAKRVPRLLEDAGNLLPGRDSTSKSHQGQQLGCTESPDVRVQSIPPNRHQLIAWQTGASMYRHSVLQIPLSANGRPFIDLL